MTTIERCKLHADLDPATEWPDDQQLEHFLGCTTAEQRLTYWRNLQDAADAGRRCWQFEHDHQLRQWREGAAARAAETATEPPALPTAVPDMSVTVSWPAERGQMQAAVYGRESAPEPDTLTALDRRIVRALLEHALSQVPIAYPVNQPVPVQLPGWH